MKILSSPRILMIVALVCLGAVFFFPLWQILLKAAQFPGGLQLYIWVNKISGTDKYILQNINILNHYIGMKAIHPDSIPELKYFPLITYVMLGLGSIMVWINKGWGYLSWAIALAILSILGIYDFYLWLYDYGHNLDPNAPIKVEGMTYMPPLLGDKDLLNFHVQSYPHWGGLFLGLAIIIAGLAYFKKRSKRELKGSNRGLNRHKPDISNKMKSSIGLVLTISFFLLMSCGTNPEPIAFGKDHCTYCKMNIVDPKFGGEVVTTKGKIFKFDALECMVPYMEQSDQEYAFTLAIAYDQPEKLVAVDSLQFLISENFNSPMGAHVAAFREALTFKEDHETYDWQSLKSHLSKNR